MNRSVRFGIMLAFVLMAGCEGMSKDEKAYRHALDLIGKHSYPQAVGVLAELGNYKDSVSIRTQLYDSMNGKTIAADFYSHIAAIKSDGTIVESDASENATGTNGWRSIKSLSAFDGYLTGINEFGSIVTTNPVTIAELEACTLNSCWAMMAVIKATQEWRSVVAFEGHYPQSAVALFEDGTVRAASSLMSNEEVAAVESWQQIVTIAESRSFIAGVREDGTVVTAGSDGLIYEVKNGLNEASQWTNIATIATGEAHIVGLKRDGTVVAAGTNRFGECGVAEWKDIVAVAAGWYYTVGLKRDGTVVVTGDKSNGKGNVGDWRDIVAIDASTDYTLGLKRDGTLVFAGNRDTVNTGGDNTAEVPDFSTFSGLIVPSV